MTRDQIQSMCDQRDMELITVKAGRKFGKMGAQILEAMKGPWDAEECWYVGGPMRGYDLWNFPAFDRRRNQLIGEGKRVVSPADLDRARGFTEDMTEFPEGSFHEAMAIDITTILYFCTGIDLLPGWSKSVGAKIEFTVAEALGKKISYSPGAEKMVVIITPVDLKHTLATVAWPDDHADEVIG